MVRAKVRRILSTAAVAAAWLAASVQPALAQCAMCRAAAGNSVEAPSIAGSMNIAVLVLIIPPVALFCSFIVLLYRYRKAPGEFPASDLVEEKAARRVYLKKGDTGARGLSKGDDDGDRPTALAKAT